MNHKTLFNSPLWRKWIIEELSLLKILCELIIELIVSYLVPNQCVANLLVTRIDIIFPQDLTFYFIF